MDRQLKKISYLLSSVLRHKPAKIGLVLDGQGWAQVDELLARLAAAGHAIDLATLRRMVETNDKQRFAFSEDGRRIRANQGHSIDIDLGIEPTDPPARLYHGTAGANLPSIRDGGLDRGDRRHVHLTADLQVAASVGARHGKSVVIAVRADDMSAAGYAFYLAANGVWLTEHVPAEFLKLPG